MKHTCLGIDVGKSTLHVCWPLVTESPNGWPVQVLDYAATPEWWQQLLNWIAPHAIVAFEPTGWHLVAPLIGVITQYTNAEVWLCGHGMTGRVRDVHIGRAKTDVYDARALALVATWIADDKAPHNVRRHNLELEQHVQRLRSLVNHRQRLVKTSTRLINRLHAFAHSIFPEIDLRFETWFPLAVRGFITPRQIKQYVLDLPEQRDRRKTRMVERLADRLPELDPPPYALEAVKTTVSSCRQNDWELRQVEMMIRNRCTEPPFDEVTARLLTIPCSGDDPVNIAPFHVACHGLLGEMTPDQVKSAIGISAVTDTSGSIDRTRAKKGGYGPAQARLYTWAMALVKESTPSNPVQLYHYRLKQRGDKHRPFRSTRAKLATMISGVARSSQGYAYPVQPRLLEKSCEVPHDS